MTEEERLRIIRELEDEVLSSKPPFATARLSKAKCEVCDSGLIGGECREHPSYLRAHVVSMNRIESQYEN
jgi:hypothetical protein